MSLQVSKLVLQSRVTIRDYFNFKNVISHLRYINFTPYPGQWGLIHDKTGLILQHGKYIKLLKNKHPPLICQGILPIYGKLLLCSENYKTVLDVDQGIIKFSHNPQVKILIL